MKRLISILVLILPSILLLAPPAATSATDIVVTPPASTPAVLVPDIVITTFGGSSAEGLMSADTLDFIELYNQSGDPVDLTNWQLQYIVQDGTVDGCAPQQFTVSAPSGWLTSKTYFTFERGTPPDMAGAEAFFSIPADLLAGCTTPYIASLTLLDAQGMAEQTVTLPLGALTAANWAQHKQRTKSSLKITGGFATDYALIANIDSKGSPVAVTLFSLPLYTPPADTSGMQIIELLPHSLSCAPTDTSLLCGDYIKLYNSSDAPVDVSSYRLRTSFGGLQSSSSNTVVLNGIVDAGAYALITAKNDAAPLSLTDTGGYVWLENAYGVKVYDPVIQYPDASAGSQVGQAWAFNGTTWLWTTVPQPTSANIFPPVEPASPAAVAVAAPSTSTLQPCGPGQERNPATNRCRSIVTAASADLQPCNPGEERNPATNRCRAVLADTTAALQPCPAGQSRNPATNRCRKVTPTPANVEDIVAAATASSVGILPWSIAGTATLLALVYAVYEWRQEIQLAQAKARDRLRRLTAVLLRHK